MLSESGSYIYIDTQYRQTMLAIHPEFFPKMDNNNSIVLFQGIYR